MTSLQDALVLRSYPAKQDLDYFLDGRTVVAGNARKDGLYVLAPPCGQAPDGFAVMKDGAWLQGQEGALAPSSDVVLIGPLTCSAMDTRRRPWPQTDTPYDILIRVSYEGEDGPTSEDEGELTVCLVHAPQEVQEAISEAGSLTDAGVDEKLLPTQAGLYQATVSMWFEQGYFEGYHCDSESSWGFELLSIKPLTLGAELLESSHG